MSKNRSAGIGEIWNWKITAACAFILVIVGTLAISFGPIHLAFGDIVKTLFGGDGLKGQDRTVLMDLRLPRMILAALVGSALATSGAVYQTVFRNPLADPYLLGAASGAGLGATIAITNAGGNIYGWLPLFSFLGATLAVLTSFSSQVDSLQNQILSCYLALQSVPLRQRSKHICNSDTATPCDLSTTGFLVS